MSAVVAMNEETRRMEQYNDIVANIKPLMTVGKGKNQRAITGSAVVPLSCCFVDLILSILVDTFFARISMPKQQYPELHNISAA